MGGWGFLGAWVGVGGWLGVWLGVWEAHLCTGAHAHPGLCAHARSRRGFRVLPGVAANAWENAGPCGRPGETGSAWWVSGWHRQPPNPSNHTQAPTQSPTCPNIHLAIPGDTRNLRRERTCAHKPGCACAPVCKCASQTPHQTSNQPPTPTHAPKNTHPPIKPKNRPTHSPDVRNPIWVNPLRPSDTMLQLQLLIKCEPLISMKSFNYGKKANALPFQMMYYKCF